MQGGGKELSEANRVREMLRLRLRVRVRVRVTQETELAQAMGRECAPGREAIRREKKLTDASAGDRRTTTEQQPDVWGGYGYGCGCG